MATSGQSSIQISDDEVFRRKLLMDGDGMGDDRRLTILLKHFFTWCNSKNETEEQIVSGYENLLASVQTCEFLMTKSRLSQAANELEIQNYDEREAEIVKNIAEVQDTIVKLKGDLKQAKKYREHKQQYDALARIISDLPDRKETETKLQALNDEIETLEKSKQELELKIQTRHKELGVLLSAAAKLQTAIKEEEGISSDSD